jgi:hypothetical protein
MRGWTFGRDENANSGGWLRERRFVMKRFVLLLLVLALGSMMYPKALRAQDQESLSGIYRAATDSCADQLALSDESSKTPGYCYLTFFADGLVRKGLPESGLEGFIEDSAARLDTASGVPSKRGGLIYIWGKYQISGDQGQLQWLDRNAPGPELDTINVKQYPKKVEIHGDTYVLLQSGNGLKLNGTYKPFGDPKEKGIKFTSDGEFVDEGILNYGATAVAVGNVAVGFEPPNGGRGEYGIENYTLTLNYASSSPSALFYLEPGESKTNVTVLYINNVKYKRVK